MTAPCAIEYILVTRWRGGKKGGQNRVCACDTRDRGVNKKLKPEHPSETVVMPESGERKRNLTTLVLVKNAAVKRSRSRQKVSESSQNPLSSSEKRRSETKPVPTEGLRVLRIRSVQVEGVKELGKEEVTSNEVPMTIQGEAQPGKGKPM